MNWIILNILSVLNKYQTFLNFDLDRIGTIVIA